MFDPAAGSLVESTQSLPAPWGSYRAWIAAALGVGLCVEIPGVLLPHTTVVLDWFLPASHLVMAAIYFIVAALAFLDALSRRHGRTLAVGSAAATMALLTIARLLSFPGVVPSGVPLVGAQTSSLLVNLINITCPALLAAALVYKGRPLVEAGRAVGLAVAVAVAGAVALTFLVVVLAPVLPPTVMNLQFTPFSHVLTGLAFVPCAIAVALLVTGFRGDPRVAPSIAAALAILVLEEASAAALSARFQPLWFAQNLLLMGPAPVLLIGQLGLYSASVRAERQAALESSFLYHATRSLATSVYPGAILSSVAHFAVGAIAASSGRHDLRASIFTVNDDVATMVAEHDMAGNHYVGLTFPLGDHRHLASVVRDRVAISASLTDLGPGPSKTVDEAQVREAIYAPLRRNERVIGVLAVAGRRNRPFRPTDLQMLEGLAGVASLALTNADNFREVEAQRQALAGSEERLRGIFDNALDAVITMNPGGVITGWNSRAEAMFGWAAAEAIGRELADTIIPEPERAAHRAGLARFSVSGDGPVLGTVFETTALRREGAPLAVELAISRPIPGPHGLSFVAFVRDVTERRRAEAARELRYNVVRELSATVTLDEAIPRLFELAGTALGCTVGQLWSFRDQGGAPRPSHRWAVAGCEVTDFLAESDALQVVRGGCSLGTAWATMDVVAVDDVGVQSDFERRHAAVRAGLRGGLFVPVITEAEMIGVLEFFSPEPGPFDEEIVEVVADVARQLGQFMARKRAETALRQGADHLAAVAATDPLTGLKNRREFERVLVSASRERFAILAIDVDGLKPVNDEHGHEAGDMLLQAVGLTLSSLVRSWDVLARVGGDEFAVILPGVGASEAATVAERMRATMHSTTTPYGQPRISIGWASAPPGADASAIFRTADAQLYCAKRAGGDRVEGGDAPDTRLAGDKRSKSLDTEMVAAVLAAGTINVIYQPIVTLRDRAVIGYEALARPESTSIVTDVSGLFVAARRLGRTRDLDWICRRAAIAQSRRLGADSVLFNNISAAALLDPVHDVDQLLMLLTSADRSPDSCVLELTEQELITDLKRLRWVTRAYREHGIRFAVDDVGAGHSTVEVLAAVNPEFIKIATSLTSTIANPGSRAAIEAMLGFARSNGATVIAEGVDREPVARALESIGVAAGQGLHLRPRRQPRRRGELPAGDIEEIGRAHREQIRTSST